MRGLSVFDNEANVSHVLDQQRGVFRIMV